MQKVLMTFVATLTLLTGGYVVVGSAQTKTSPPAKSASQIKTTIIPVEGMSCASCAARIKRTLKGMSGVTDAEVSLEKRNVRVRYQEKKVTPKRLQAAINALGYKAKPPVPVAERKK